MSEKGLPAFTVDQQSAMDYRRVDACVVAGPGAGKTTVLVQRYRSLVEDYHFEPRQILAITFTEKAAANMKARLAELFAHNAPLLRELESAWVSTIHGFCARLLRENAIAAGIDPRFTVLDARESEELQYVCVNAALDELVSLRREDTLALIQALHAPSLAGDLTRAYDAIRCAGKTVAEIRAMPNATAGVTPAMMADSLRGFLANWTPTLTAVNREHRADLLEWAERISSAADPADAVLTNPCPLKLNKVPTHDREPLRTFQKALPFLTAWAIDQRTARHRELIFDALARFDELYNERKLAMGALDFNDLERHAVRLLRERIDVRDRVRAQFRQVMLDEFQDINQQQSDLIDLVRADDVFFAVGDINQAIYGFRYASTEIFSRYRDHIDATHKHSVQLFDNFRSRPAILRTVESLLNTLDGIEPRAHVAGASFAAKSEHCVEVLKIQAREGEDAAAKEARWIARRILSLRGTLPADFSDFAVLCRNGESMKPILAAFDHAGIPYVSGRRPSFLLSREGRDLIALLRIIANPQDTISLATVLRSPLAGLGDESLLRLRLLGQSITSGMNRIAYDRTLLTDFDPAEAEKIIRFTTNLRRWREAQPVMPLELILVRAMDDCGFAWTPGTVAADNIESFLHLARGKGADRTLEDFLREIESLEQAFDFESDLADRDQGNVVQVMTAHAAKGLEFPVTIIAAMDKGTQRNSSPITYTPAFGLGVKWRAPGDKDRDKAKDKDKGVSDSWHLRNAAEIETREKHEEHRLLYVAMTRAEEHLILSFSRGKGAPRNWAKLVDQIEASDDISVLDTADEPPALDTAAIPALAAEILVLPRPALSDQHDSAVNVTSLAVFADCPRKYYLSRYIGWNGRRFASFDPEEDLPPDDESDLSAAELGSAVHEILASKPGSYPPEAHRLADVFLTSTLGTRAAASPRAAREWDFIIDIDGTLIRGTIDLWFEDNGEITLVDYKTDVHINAEAYTPQLALYALAIERAFGKRPAHAWLHFLRSDTLIDVPLDYPVRELLAELRTAQDQLRFDLREGDHCHSCQFYRSLCPAGLTAETAPPASQTPLQSSAAS